MDRKKTVRTLFIISIIIHGLYILICTIIIASQSMYLKDKPSIVANELKFILPYGFICSLLSFIIHLTLTLVIIGMMKDVFNTRFPEVVGIVIYSLSFSYINSLIMNFQFRKVYSSMTNIAAFTYINQRISMVDFLSRVAIILFVVACGMSWYRKTTLREYNGPEIE